MPGPVEPSKTVRHNLRACGAVEQRTPIERHLSTCARVALRLDLPCRGRTVPLPWKWDVRPLGLESATFGTEGVPKVGPTTLSRDGRSVTTFGTGGRWTSVHAGPDGQAGPRAADRCARRRGRRPGAVTDIVTRTGIARTSLHRHLPPRLPEQGTSPWSRSPRRPSSPDNGSAASVVVASASRLTSAGSGRLAKSAERDWDFDGRGSAPAVNCGPPGAPRATLSDP